MQVRERIEATSSRPAAMHLPVDLGSGRLSYVRIVLAWLLALLGLAVAGLAGWLLLLAAGLAGLSPSWGVCILGLVVVASLYLSGHAVQVQVQEIRDYQTRVDEWHQAALDQYERTPQAEISSITHERMLSAARADHKLLTAIAIHLRAERGDELWSVRALAQDELWIETRPGRHVKLGQVENPALMLKELADAGLIEGRGDRKSGRWSCQSLDELVRRIL